ncbi:MAG: CpsD/CapB family tyrosine-protein kinase [Caldibacillus sp.]
MAKLKKVDFKRNRLIAKTAPKSPITEQYRTIRTNIQFSAVDTPIRSLMVTSAGPSEGKSTTASNLAVVFAQQGKKVLIVDADLRRPTLHFTFGFTNTIGLTNVLTRQIHINESIRTTDVENLYFMPSGPIPPNPAELLGSATMDQLISDLYEMFDLVIFDVPPVLAVADAQVLGNQVDATILVVSSGLTEREGAIKAKEILEQTKSKLLGAVLNNKEEDRSTHYYYYYS